MQIHAKLDKLCTELTNELVQCCQCKEQFPSRFDSFLKIKPSTEKDTVIKEDGTKIELPVLQIYGFPNPLKETTNPVLKKENESLPALCPKCAFVAIDKLHKLTSEQFQDYLKCAILLSTTIRKVIDLDKQN